MALQFQPPNSLPAQLTTTPAQSFEAGIAPTLQTLPELYMQYQVRKQELAMKLAEMSKKYGTGEPLSGNPNADEILTKRGAEGASGYQHAVMATTPGMTAVRDPLSGNVTYQSVAPGAKVTPIGGGGMGAATLIPKLQEQMMQDLDPSKARGGALAMQQNKLNAAEHLQSLIDQSGGNPNRMSMEELAMGAANMVTGGNATTMDQVNSLVPQSARGDTNKLLGYFLNKPVGTDQQEFVRSLQDSINRNKAIAKQIIQRAQAQRLAGHRTLHSIDPESFNAIISTYGLDPAKFKNGQYIDPDLGIGGGPQTPAQSPAMGAPSSQGQKVLDRNTAAQFLQQAGGDKNKARQLALQNGYQF